MRMTRAFFIVHSSWILSPCSQSWKKPGLLLSMSWPGSCWWRLSWASWLVWGQNISSFGSGHLTMALQRRLWYSASRSQLLSRWPPRMDLDSILKCCPRANSKASWRYGRESPFIEPFANGLNKRLNTPRPFYSSPAFASPNYRFWSSFATWLPHPWIAASPSCWEYLLDCGLLPAFSRRYFNVMHHGSGIIYMGSVSIEWVTGLSLMTEMADRWSYTRVRGGIFSASQTSCQRAES